MRTVKEVSKLTGVSVRTLHHYDAIGLLKPAKVTDAGYRLYDDTALHRLQSILLFRELQFPLKEIKEILDNPSFEPEQALEQQIELLERQYRHIGQLISFARAIQSKGVYLMNFEIFDRTEMEAYKEEAKAKWGTTEAYRECAEKTKKKSECDQLQTAERLMELFSEIGALRQLSPGEKPVQEKIHAVQDFISDNYYTCTSEILRGLGQMYAADERFRRSIDQAGGEGTAEFVSRAISIYCS